MKNLNLLLLFILTSCAAFAGNFTPGNLVVIRVGNGTDTLSGAAARVYLDEYSISGVLVQSIAMPTVANGGNHRFTLTGSSNSEGELSLSANGQYLSLAGYDADLGFPSVATDTTPGRTVARVGADGIPNTSTGFSPGSAYRKGNIRGSVSNDGNEFWCSGTSSSSSGGTYYLPFGSFTSSPVHVSTTITNTHTVGIFDGQLYTTGTRGINTVGSGLPTTSANLTAALPGFTSTQDSLISPYSFYFFDLSPDVPGNDVLYLCDERTSNPNGGIYKFSLVGGVWVDNGNIPSSSALRGLTGFQACSSINLFASATNGIYKLVDTTGYNQNITGSFSLVVASASKTLFRGIALAPGTTAPASFVAAITSVHNSTCNNQHNGSITLSIVGGITPYKFHWSDNDSIQNKTGLAAGNYSITATDAGGCSISASASITEPPAISISAAVTNLACSGNNADTGAIQLTVTGGASPYTYLWNNSATTSGITGLGTGVYTVIVTDTTSCSASFSATISNTGDLLIHPVVTNVTCNGYNNGSITTAPTGGNPGYTFSWSNDSTSQSISNLSPGNYTITVNDNGGCSAVNTIGITQPVILTYSTSVTNVSCYGDTNGAVHVTIHGGTAPYTYLWNNSVDSANLNGVVGGNYILTVTDNHSCLITVSATINQPTDSISYIDTITNVSSSGGSDGSIALYVFGGTPGYNYFWTNTDTTESISGLVVGNYCVAITDHNLCQASACFNVTLSTGIQETDLIEKFVAYQSGDNLMINVSLKENTSSSISIYDVTGKNVFNSNPEVTTHIEKQISLAQISSGYYLIRISTPQGAIGKQITIVK